jgi:hypothetical protein
MKAPTKRAAIGIVVRGNRGTYVIPYLCHWIEGGWHAVKFGKQIQATVVDLRTRTKGGV